MLLYVVSVVLYLHSDGSLTNRLNETFCAEDEIEDSLFGVEPKSIGGLVSLYVVFITKWIKNSSSLVFPVLSVQEMNI